MLQEYRPKPIDVRYENVKLRERTIPPDAAAWEGIRYREARSLPDDYQAMMMLRKMQYPEYYKNIPKAPSDKGHLKWWIGTVPFIAKVDLVMDAGAINIIKDATNFQSDFYQNFDFDDMMDEKMPRDLTADVGTEIRENVNSLNRRRAQNLKDTRQAVYNDTMTRFIKKAAASNSLPAFRSQLLRESDVKDHEEKVAQFKHILGPHIKSKYGPTKKQLKAKFGDINPELKSKLIEKLEETGPDAGKERMARKKFKPT